MSKFFKGTRDNILVPVTAKCPADGGREVKINFKARYRVPPVDEIREISDATQAGTMSDEDVINRLLLGWEDVVDASDEQIEFNDENLKAALQEAPYRTALVDGAMQILFGKEVLRLKNSRKSAAHG